MRAERRSILAASAAALLLLLAACGSPGSGGGQAEPTSSGATGVATCDPVKGDALVVLDDDKGLQNADNVIPALNAAAVKGDTAIIPLLDSVSKALDTDKLIALNKAVDVDRRTSTEVAQEFVDKEGLAAQDAGAGAGKTVKIGAANFSENATLGAIYADVLKSAGYTTSVQTIGNRETYLPALESGDLTLVPEYAATLAEFLNTGANGKDATPVASGDVDKTVAALTSLGKDVGLTFGAVSPAQDKNAFAVTTAFADKHKVKSLSDLAKVCGNLVLAGPPECETRPFCQPGLEDKYGLTFADLKTYDFGLIGDAVRHGEAAIGLVLSSDGTLGS
jgi:osmoprotectant transport system substrate-binding protein